MERNAQDQILSLAEAHGVMAEWADPGDGNGWLEIYGTLSNFVSFAEAYSGVPEDLTTVYRVLVRTGFQETLFEDEDEVEFTGTPDAFWAFVSSL